MRERIIDRETESRAAAHGSGLSHLCSIAATTQRPANAQSTTCAARPARRGDHRAFACRTASVHTVSPTPADGDGQQQFIASLGQSAGSAAADGQEADRQKTRRTTGPSRQEPHAPAGRADGPGDSPSPDGLPTLQGGVGRRGAGAIGRTASGGGIAGGGGDAQRASILRLPLRPLREGDAWLDSRGDCRQCDRAASVRGHRTAGRVGQGFAAGGGGSGGRYSGMPHCPGQRQRPRGGVERSIGPTLRATGRRGGCGSG